MSHRVDLQFYNIKTHAKHASNNPAQNPTNTNPIDTTIGQNSNTKNNENITLSQSQNLVKSTHPKLLEYGIDLSKPLVITEELKNKIKAQGPKGFFESLVDNAKNAIPFVSTFMSIWNNGKLLLTLKKAEKNGFNSLSNEEKEQIILYQLEQAEKSYRETTFMGKVGEMLSHLPAFAGEFLLTGGAYRLGANFVEKAAGKIITNKIAMAVSKVAVGSLTRAAIGLSHRTINNTLERQINTTLYSKPEEQEGVLTSVGKAFTDNYIETLSEQSGAMFGFLGSKYLGKYLSNIPILKHLIVSPKAQSLMAKAGFHGIFEEFMEERFGGFLRGVVGLDQKEFFKTKAYAERLLNRKLTQDEFESFAKTDKFKAIQNASELERYLKYIGYSTIPTLEQAGVETVSTAIWGGTLHTGHKVANTAQMQLFNMNLNKAYRKDVEVSVNLYDAKISKSEADAATREITEKHFKTEENKFASAMKFLTETDKIQTKQQELLVKKQKLAALLNKFQNREMMPEKHKAFIKSAIIQILSVNESPKVQENIADAVEYFSKDNKSALSGDLHNFIELILACYDTNGQLREDYIAYAKEFDVNSVFRPGAVLNNSKSKTGEITQEVKDFVLDLKGKYSINIHEALAVCKTEDGKIDAENEALLRALCEKGHIFAFSKIIPLVHPPQKEVDPEVKEFVYLLIEHDIFSIEETITACVKDGVLNKMTANVARKLIKTGNDSSLGFALLDVQNKSGHIGNDSIVIVDKLIEKKARDIGGILSVCHNSKGHLDKKAVALSFALLEKDNNILLSQIIPACRNKFGGFDKKWVELAHYLVERNQGHDVDEIILAAQKTPHRKIAIEFAKELANYNASEIDQILLVSPIDKKGVHKDYRHFAITLAQKGVLEIADIISRAELEPGKLEPLYLEYALKLAEQDPKHVYEKMRYRSAVYTGVYLDKESHKLIDSQFAIQKNRCLNNSSLYVAGEYDSARVAQKRLNVFFDNYSAQIKALLAIFDKETVDIILRKRTDKAMAYFSTLDKMKLENMRLLHSLANSLNQDGKPLMPQQKLDLLNILATYDKNDLDLSKAHQMFSDGKVNIADLQVDLLRQVFDKSGINKNIINATNAEALSGWDLQNIHLLATELAKENNPALVDLVKATLQYNFDRYISRTSNIYGAANLRTKETFASLGMNYDAWVKPSQSTEVQFASVNKQKEQLRLIGEAFAGDIEILRQSRIKGFFDKKFGQYLRNDKFIIPQDILGNKEKLYNFIKNINVQLAQAWDRAELNLRNVNMNVRQNAMNALTIKHHIEQKMSEIQKIDKTNASKKLDLRIKMWDRKPQRDIFQGNYSTCCIGLGNSYNSRSMVYYLMNTAFNMIEMVDAGGDTIGNALIYYVKDTNGRPVLIIDNVEINNAYRVSDEVGERLLESIIQFAKNVNKEVVGNENVPIYMGKNYNDVPTSIYKSKKEKLSLVGEFSNDEIYLDLFGGWTKRKTDDYSISFIKLH